MLLNVGAGFFVFFLRTVKPKRPVSSTLPRRSQGRNLPQSEMVHFSALTDDAEDELGAAGTAALRRAQQPLAGLFEDISALRRPPPSSTHKTSARGRKPWNQLCVSTSFSLSSARRAGGILPLRLSIC